ncbi:MAG: hypothetical protein ACYC27_22740, partial [Armatimonadota bacterium]
MTWFFTISAVFSNQKALIWFNTWPLNGMLARILSNALWRSVVIRMRESPRRCASWRHAWLLQLTKEDETMKKYILFDHDGVLVDTEFWYYKA